MVEKRDIQPGSWETLSVEDKVEALKSFITSKFPDEEIIKISPPEDSQKSKKGRR